MDSHSENNPAALASRVINHTNKHIFLTGKAGTGKTTFLKHIIRYTHKKAVIVAPTGIAAINAGGTTIHSLFQLPFGNFIPVSISALNPNQAYRFTDPASLMRNMQMSAVKRAVLRELELLIIDEVSMLRSDLLDAIDTVLRSIRKRNQPFGGVQVLFIGDLLQLPPVVKDEEWQVLKNYYKSAYFFDAKVLQDENPLYIELQKVFRQSDDTFISLLNNLRSNSITAKDIELLNTFYKPSFKPAPEDNYVTLTTHNYKADKLNKDYLNELKGTSFFFKATVKDDFGESAYPVGPNLELKLGAQVMFVKNDPSGQQRFFNGKIGTVCFLSTDEIKVQFSDTPAPLAVETYEWQNVKYAVNEATNEIEETVGGTFSQYPLKLAWAITIHKSQGLTFDKAIVDIGQAFAPGQVYVALSRLRSLNGLVLASEVNFKAIEQDQKVTSFSGTQPKENELDFIIKKEENTFLRNYLSTCFDITGFEKAVTDHLETYTKDETRSIKQRSRSWALELKTTIEPVKNHADAFVRQLNGILQHPGDEQFVLLGTRVKAASDYFLPIFKKISDIIFKQLEEIKEEKKIKAYLHELLDLETFCYEQQKRIRKAEVLTDALLYKKEFTAESVSHITNDQLRVKQIKALLTTSITSKLKPGQKPQGEKKKKEKQEKPDTKAITFNLYKEGKTIEEIAALREFTISTIAGHLVQYVAKGELNVSEFVDDKKSEQVIAVAKELDSFQAGVIKTALGEKFSYTEIKFAIAGYLADK
jgi:nucleoside-triphosphatase THEP1